MKSPFKKICGVAILSLITINGYAANDKEGEMEKFAPIHTAVPSLGIAPDARGGGMGDIGAATLPDVFSQYWNPSKYAFSSSKAGVAISYTPWLRKLVNDIALMQAVGYFKFGDQENQALSASIRYFSIGEVPTHDGNNPTGTVSPYEMAVDIGYSRKLTETFSGGVAIRYIGSDYSTGQGTDASTAGSAFAVDVSGYNESYIMVGQAESLLGLGFNISNIGTKLSTDDGETNQFIPANLKLGASLTYPLDEYNTLAFNADLNKILVPALELKDGDDKKEAKEKYSNTSGISGIFKSFSGGDQLKKITFSLGAEYMYNNQFAVRGGYYHEDAMMGNRKYFTVGAGFKMNVFQLDAAYLVSAAQNNPLDQTLRFSLSFDMDGLRNLTR